MKHQNSHGPRLGKSVHQLPGVINFSYDLRFNRMIARWEDLSEDYKNCQNFHDEIFSVVAYPKKRHLGPQNGSRSSGPEKMLKIVNYQNFQKHVLGQLEKVGGHRYPPGSPFLPSH